MFKNHSKIVAFLLVFVLVSSVLTGCDFFGDSDGENKPNAPIVATVKFNSNGGTEINGFIYTVGEELPALPNKPTKATSVFQGWFYDDTTFEQPFSMSDLLDVDVSKTITLFAKWNFIDVAKSIQETDFNTLQPGSVLDFGISELEVAERDKYSVVFSNEGYLDYSNYCITVIGIGNGKLTIKDAQGQVLFDDYFQVSRTSPVVVEFKHQLVRQGDMLATENNMPNSQLAKIKELTLNRIFNDNINAAKALELLPNIESLTLTNNDLKDVSFLAKNTKLKHLNISNNKIVDLTPIKDLWLETLNFDNNAVASLTPINTVPLSELKSLSFKNNLVTNISPINNLLDLTELYVGGNNITEIAPISSLTNIKKLDFSYTNVQASKVINLTYFGQLEMLDISGLKLDLYNLPTSLPELKELSVANCTDVTSSMSVDRILGYTSLTKLNIKGNRLEVTEMEKITYLGIHGNAPLTNLTHLSIGDNRNSDLPNLTKMTSLEMIDISDSKNLVDISSINSLPNKALLKELYVDNCSSLENEERHTEGELMNAISSLTALEQISMIDGLHYFNKDSFNALVARLKDDSDPLIKVRILEEEWVDAYSIDRVKSAFFFSFADFTKATTVDNNVYSINYVTGQRVVALSLVSDLRGKSSLNLNATIKVPAGVRELKLVGLPTRPVNDLNIVFEDRLEIDFTLSLYNFKFSAPTDKHAVYSEWENTVYIQTYLSDNAISAGSQSSAESARCAIVARNVYIFADAPVTITGGNGKNGSNGSNGATGSVGASTSSKGQKGGAGGTGGAGTNGTNGANGGAGVKATLVALSGEVSIIGGNGGNGGTGGNGGNGGIGGDSANDWDLFSKWGLQGGNGGVGGTGGAGGVGGKAGYAVDSVTISAAGNVKLGSGMVGKGGNGGSGGTGGTGGASGSAGRTNGGGTGGAGGTGGSGGGYYNQNAKPYTSNNSITYTNISLTHSNPAGEGGSGGSGGTPGVNRGNNKTEGESGTLGGKGANGALIG